MASLNKAILIGNLGADPETRYSANGNAITNLRIATTDVYVDKQTGERKESTEWHRIVMFNRLAEIAGQYLRKGSQIYIEGRIQTRKWVDQSGQDRYSTEVVANEMKMLGRRNELSSEGMSEPMAKPARPVNKDNAPPANELAGSNDFADLDDDVPF